MLKRPASTQLAPRRNSASQGEQLLDLGRDLLEAELVQRPSKRNKSPWVADVRLKGGRVALAHVPALDMGGLCVTGSKLLLKLAVDGKGRPIGSKAVGAYGTPKCEFILQLVYVNEPENKHMGGCWCAAHPSLGEKLAAALVEKNLIRELPKVDRLRKEVTGVAGTDMRADFLLEHAGNKATAIEVKTVLNTDYNPATPPDRKECVYFPQRSTAYRRAAIFPWGRVSQVGPQGEQVVSARAIKHIDELAAIARGDRKDKGGVKISAMLLFMVVRPDAVSMRVNDESCPSFAKHVQVAEAAGVRILAHKVCWGKGRDLGKAFWVGPLPVNVPASLAKRPASGILATRNVKAKR